MPKLPAKKLRPSTPRTPAPHSSSNPTEPQAFGLYQFYGVEVEYSGRKESPGVCPFCSSSDAFSVSESGAYRCLRASCGAAGGPTTFLESFYQHCLDATQPRDYRTLMEDRALEFVDTPLHWGLVLNPLTGHWLIPGYEFDGKLRLVSLYQYVRVKQRRSLMLPAGARHTLLGLPLYDPAKEDVYLLEGPWDALRFWEVMSRHKFNADAKPVPTGHLKSSLAAGVNILATPGCLVLNEDWLPLFRGKSVALMYDNDHPKRNPTTGALSVPGGYAGMKFATRRLAAATCEIGYVEWGPDGYDPTLPDGYDVRDLLRPDAETLLPNFTALFDKITPVPSDWLDLKAAVARETIPCLSCDSYEQLVVSWRKALKWSPGLDHALAVMLATVASTKCLGDQLWIKVVGPPASGKTTLAEALTVARDYVIAKSTLRGFHSGYRLDPRNESEDNSLIPQISGKTLITKDGDTLLQAPNLAQILAEARDLYDCVSRTHYRNRTSREYENVRMTWILCGTESLRSLDDSELGQRFLDCVVMEPSWLLTQEGLSLEDEILWRQVNKSVDQVAVESDGKPVSFHSPSIVECYGMTGGYVNYLRKNAATGIAAVNFTEGAKRQCMHLGKFIAYMRARPSKRQIEHAERELAARLVAQLARLTRCLGFVLNRNSIAANDIVMERVRRVALDTSRGLVLDIVKVLHRAGMAGSEFKGINVHVNCGDTELRAMLNFLKAIGVTKRVITTGRSAWALTDGLKLLYETVTRTRSPQDK